MQSILIVIYSYIVQSMLASVSESLDVCRIWVIQILDTNGKGKGVLIIVWNGERLSTNFLIFHFISARNNCKLPFTGISTCSYWSCLLCHVVFSEYDKVLSTCIYVYIKSEMYNMFLLFTLILTEYFLLSPTYFLTIIDMKVMEVIWI